MDAGFPTAISGTLITNSSDPFYNIVKIASSSPFCKTSNQVGIYNY